MRIAIIILLTCLKFSLIAQNNSDGSLFFRKNSTTYLDKVFPETGDLYNLPGHHGPAIENEWLGLRLYFNDVREMLHKRLEELREYYGDSDELNDKYLKTYLERTAGRKR